MERIERVCPKCGTSNSFERATCVRCGTSLIHLPAASRSNVPAPLENKGTAALALGASAFVARLAFRLLRRHVLPRATRAIVNSVKPSQIARREPQMTRPDTRAPEPEADYVIRGWRVWSVRRGDQQSSGSEQFEWRINKKK